MFSLPHAESKHTAAAHPCCGPTPTLSPTHQESAAFDEKVL